MYGLSDMTDLSFFHGKALVQVCLGCNESILWFDDNLSVVITTEVGHKSADVLMAIYYTAIPSASLLASLLHFTVTKASVKAPSTRILAFSNGETLEIDDSNPQFESYIIRNGDSIIIV